MNFGLIGKKLSHSFSKEIHEQIGKYKYELIELNEEEFKEFMENKNFKAINVTIPYKEKVIPYLSHISDEAKAIGCVNTIVNKNGELYGYNTDYHGLKEMINYFNIEILNKNIAILGDGGTSKTAHKVFSDLNAKSIDIVSRHESNDKVSYEYLNKNKEKYNVIINTTPVGMYPNNNDQIIDLNGFNNLNGVIDVIYNPLRTNLTLQAQEKKIKNCNGLYMLIAQAVYAIEIFLNKEIDKSIIASIYRDLLYKKENIVLIGMPSCGKTTVAKLLKRKLKKPRLDTDIIIRQKINIPIKDYFIKYGEAKFREIESEVINDISKETGLIIATGGGSILNEKNIKALKQNGKLIFLDRPLRLLLTTSNRPLSSNYDDLKKLFEYRYPLYKKACDVRVNADNTLKNIINEIIGGLNK